MTRHSCTIKICLDDFRSGREAVEKCFELIDKVRAAVTAKSGKVINYTFSNEPDRELNPLGVIGTFTFDIRTPYKCEASLDFNCATGFDQKPWPIVNFNISFK